MLLSSERPEQLDVPWIPQARVKQKLLTTGTELAAAVEGVRTAVAAAFPEGLPEWDLVRRVLEDREELTGTLVRMAPDEGCPMAFRHGPVLCAAIMSCQSSTLSK